MEKKITSTSNPYVKHLKKLQTSKKYREENRRFVLEGERPVKDAMAYGINPETLLVTEKFADLFKGDNVTVITENVSQHISDTKTSQGIMAEVSMPVWNAKDIETEKYPFLVFCDGVADPGNMGTIIRTLECAGVNGVIVGSGSVDVYNPKTVRSTMAALFLLPIFRAQNNAEAIKTLKKKGYTVIGTRMENAADYTEADYNRPVVLVVGNEANGISKEVMSLCDEFVSIPINGKTESLNVAIATAVIAFEIKKHNK